MARIHPAPAMQVPRTDHAAISIEDGRVLVCGGRDSERPDWGIEIYDPERRAWTRVGQLGTARARHTIEWLDHARFLVLGGDDARSERRASTEIIDVAPGIVTEGPPMSVTRAGHRSARLDDGRILVVGGAASDHLESDFFDPQRGAFFATAAYQNGGTRGAAVALRDGRVLIVGGTRDPGAVEVFVPENGRIEQLEPMHDEHGAGLSATRLPDGRVVVAGGEAGDPVARVSRSVEVFEPKKNRFVALGQLCEPRRAHGAVRTPEGHILFIGGATVTEQGVFIPSTTAELFDPFTGTSQIVIDDLPPTTVGCVAALLPEHRVLVAGGANERGEATDRCWVIEM